METWQIWGDVATWVTGVATIALFIIGFLQIRNERKERLHREKDQEVRQRRSQAELVSCWRVKENREGSWLGVLNNSPQPIYQVIVSVVRLGQLGDSMGEYAEDGQMCISIAPPGIGYILVNPWGFGMAVRFGVEISFKDAAGRNWLIKPDGELSQIEESPLGYYKIGLPTYWRDLQTILPPDEIIGQNNLND
jgi:hypothetical protein